MAYIYVLSAPAADVQGGNGELKAAALRKIKVLLVVYVYDAVQDTFKQVPGMPAHVPLQIHNAMKALQLINEGSILFDCSTACAIAGNLACFMAALPMTVKLQAMLLAVADFAAGEHGML